MRRPEADEAPESDSLAGAPHPRHAQALIGHQQAEAEMLSAYREGRLAHAWLIGGPEGIGKATLAWRFARFLLANPDPRAPRRARRARSLGRPEGAGRAPSYGARASRFLARPAGVADRQEEIL